LATPDNTPYSPPTAGAETGRLMRRATLFSLSVGILLVALKTGAWLFTGSLSIMSSLADSMLDVIASALNFVAVRYALQPPDREHRFGHGKAEELATLAQSTFICGSGVFLVIEGIKRLISPEPVHNNAVGLEVMAVSILLTLALIFYQRYVVRKTASSAIAADAVHYAADFLTNAGVIAALILSSAWGWTSADPLVAIGIAGYIIWSAFSIGSKAFQNLMDHEFSDEDRLKIAQIVRAYPEALGLHDLRTRKSGIYRFIQFHLDLSGDITLKRAHEISDNVEDLLLVAFPNTEILIHQDPLHGDRTKEHPVAGARQAT
jgi:ferrous-iron efflux pump FieF